MPLWYHPPAVPVNLGAPVYPGPLMYHPAPVLVDPRPQYPCDTLYCACQFSIGPAPPPHWSSNAAPPAITTLPEKPNTIKKHVSWAGPSSVETEWEYELKRPTGPAVDVAVERNNTQDGRRLNIRLSGGHLRAHYAPPSNTAAERVSKVVSLDEETVERIRAEIRKDFEKIHGKNAQAQAQAPPAELEITRQHDHIKKDSDQSKEISEKEKMEKIRDEVRKEMAATYDEKMKSLEARELDIQRRMDAIRKREAQWIESYGEGIIKGKPAESVRPQSPPEVEEQNFVSDLDNVSANEEEDLPAALSEDEPQKTPRPMRWLFRDHELKSYYESPLSGGEEDRASTTGDSSSGHDETVASPQSSTLRLESTSESVKAHVAHLTGATKSAGLFGKVSQMFSSRPSSRMEETNTFRDVPAAEGSCYNFELFDAGPSRQPWKWFETGRNENVSKATVMGPTYNISSLISNPDGISLKRSYEQTPHTSANGGMTGRTNPDTEFQQKPPSSSCSSSYVSALRDLKLDDGSPKKSKFVFGIRGSKDSLALPRSTNSSQSTVIKTPQASPLEKGIPELRNHFSPDKQATASPLNMKGEDSPSSPVVEAKQPVYDAPPAPLVKKESSVSDVSEAADLEDRDFSFCEPFYDWSIHDNRLHEYRFRLPTKKELYDRELQAAAPLRSAPGSINFEENSNISSNLFKATKYMMRGARLTKPDIRMTGELKWPPSPTVYTLSSTSSSDNGEFETRHDQNTAADTEGDLLLSNEPILNPNRSPTKRPAAVEQSHILDEPIVFAANPYMQFHSPPITPTKSHSPPLSKNVRVFTFPPSTIGHELSITISRSVSETSTHSDDGRDAPPPTDHEKSIPPSSHDHFEDAANERKSKRVKSVHWGASTEAERQFAVSEGMSYYEVDSDEHSDPEYDWSEDGEDGNDEENRDDGGDGDDEDGELDDEGEEDDGYEGEGDASSLCGSQASTKGVVDATY